VSDSAPIRLGTSAFTAAGWPGSFYPEDLKPADYLSYYAEHFDTVEVDSTFYRSPSPAVVRGWYAKTPADFLFAAKVPREITHEKVLVDCEAALKNFLSTMDLLGEKLGPLLFQFPYFNRAKFKSGAEFLALLAPFLEKLPRGYRFAVELRNKTWLDARLAELLLRRGVCLALIDHPWLPRPAELFRRFDPVTADFGYIRWLGDRKAIEERTKTWNETIVDRRRELREWFTVVYKLTTRGVPVFAYANNHYAGHAPATVRFFQEMLAHPDDR
jgi:uncharacterized protein YecE (DUF72 family)